MVGEFDLIRWIKAQSAVDAADVARAAQVQTGIGDDLAVLQWNCDDLLLVGVDQVLDGVHFHIDTHAPELIGRKVMNRNLSDCAAMACLPVAAVATVALPQHHPQVMHLAQQLLIGMKQAGAKYDCVIVGGDTASWAAPLVVTVSILGRSAGVAPITRAGAKSGDGIYTTGPLGGSILGRHLTFEPRIALARQLAQTGAITAMIDLSDGLSRDLGHICSASGVGAIIEAEQIPIHPDACQLSDRDHMAPLDHALNDGEDYELLFTASQPVVQSGITRIGTITADRQILLRRNGQSTVLKPLGWQHIL